MFAGVIDLAAGQSHSMLLKKDGSVWSSGLNHDLQLGIDSSVYQVKNFIQAIPSGAKAISAGSYHSIVLKKDTTVWTTGRNSEGQLGDGSETSRNNFSPVKNILPMDVGGAKAVAAGGFHSMVLMQDGSVSATGWNKYGQIGDGSTTDWTKLFQVISGDAKAVAAGDVHSMVLK